MLFSQKLIAFNSFSKYLLNALSVYLSLTASGLKTVQLNSYNGYA